MKMVHPFEDKDANMVLIEAVRGGGAWMKVEAPVIVYKEPGVYTDEIYSDLRVLNCCEGSLGG